MKELAKCFDKVTYTFLPRAKNKFEDALSTLASMIEFPSPEGEEVAHPNPPANPVQAIPPEPDLNSVKNVMKDRLLVHRLGQRHATVSETEISRIIDLKGQIIDRMAQLDFSPFWNQHRNTLIQDYLRPPRGGEFKISTLENKLQDLVSENATNSSIYKELVRAREFFHIDGPFRGPTG